MVSRRGRKEGHHADLVVLDDDYFAVSDEGPEDINSVLTVVSGKVAHEGRSRVEPSHMTIEHIHIEGNDPKWNMPYTPALKVTGGSTIYVSGVTAAPLYHSHPHDPSEFVDIPDDAGEQAEMTMENLQSVLEASGAGLGDIVQLIRFMVDQDRNQDAINRVMGSHLGDHRPASTSVEVVRLATDPRLILELQAIAVTPT